MNKFISIFIVLGITSIITLSSVFSIEASLKDGSNIELISRGYRYVKNHVVSKNDQLLESKKQFPEVPDTQFNICDNSSKSSTSSANYNSVVDYMDSIGEDFSFENRVKIASLYGISDYTGTTDQNLKLITLISQERNNCTLKW